MGWGALVGNIIEAVQKRQFRSADNRIEGNRIADEYERQKEFAQMGVRWRVADADAAHISPLAALGASSVSYSPAAVGVNSSGYVGDYGRMGQAIDRITKSETLEEKEERKLILDMRREELRKMGIEADIKQEELNRIRSSPAFPSTSSSRLESAFGIPGQDQGGYMAGVISEPGGETGVRYVPNELPMKSQPGIEAGIMAMEGWAQHKDGSISPIISRAASESVESSPVDALSYGLGKGYDYARGLYHGMGFSGAEARGAYLQELEQIQPPSPLDGWEWRYWPPNGHWYLCRGGGRRVMMSIHDEFYNWKDERKGEYQ